MLVRRRVVALNRFLSDVYRREVRMSILLTESGFAEDDISRLRVDHMDEFTKIVVDMICSQIQSMSNGERRLDIIKRRYGLDGGAQWTLAQVGERYNLSRERIRQIQKSTVRRFATKRSKARFEEAIAKAANFCLDR